MDQKIRYLATGTTLDVGSVVSDGKEQRIPLMPETDAQITRETYCIYGHMHIYLAMA